MCMGSVHVWDVCALYNVCVQLSVRFVCEICACVRSVRVCVRFVCVTCARALNIFVCAIWDLSV